MSEQIREQVSAFLDGELPNTETELLLKRLTRDAELRESFGRYALIGEVLRGSSHPHLSRNFAARVTAALDGDATPVGVAPPRLHAPRWWKPFAGAALVAGVAAVAVVALQQRAVGPGRTLSAANQPAVAPASAPLAPAANGEPSQPYTTPVIAEAGGGMLPPGRLTNYVFAHSKYSVGLGQRGVLADLLIEDDVQPPAPRPTSPTPNP
jgi:sigma-E factor negative regulatory protein RseA